MLSPKLFTVFEHRPLRVHARNSQGQEFTDEDFALLADYHLRYDGPCPFFSLSHRAVLFHEYVGVLQIGPVTIEVLPKTDESGQADSWRSKLIGMLHRVHHFDVQVSSTAVLSLHPNSILEYYINLFLSAVNGLLHQGLVKKYRQQEQNARALKGKILFAQQVSHNLLHRERFYISAPVYDANHALNQILYQALQLVSRITVNSTLVNASAALLLAFPEPDPVRITETLFERLTFDRKTEGYRAAIGIARLLLLRYHPNIVRGKSDVLALLFDMNLLWEQFVYVVLKTRLADCQVAEQVRKSYWKAEGTRDVVLMPDIVIRKGGQSYVVDTKWKVMRSNSKPAVQDLQQMFAYTKYYTSSHTLLLYPGVETKLWNGHFYAENAMPGGNVPLYPCSIGLIGLRGAQTLQEWERSISDSITEFLGL